MTIAFSIAGTRAAFASSATITPALPTTTGLTGGVLIAEVHVKNNATILTATTGWIPLGTQTNSGASFTRALFIAPLGSAAPVFTWTGSAACGAVVTYYEDPNNPMSVASALGATTVNTGTTNPHTSGSIVSTSAPGLFLIVDSAALNSGLAAAAGWTSDLVSNSGTDVASITFISKAILAVGAASGGYSANGGLAAWVQGAYELKIAPAAAGLQTTLAEAVTVATPADGLAATLVEATAVSDPGIGLSATLVEATAVSDPGDGLSVTLVEIVCVVTTGTIPVTGRRRGLIIN